MLETVLYYRTEQEEAVEHFYRDVLGLRPLGYLAGWSMAPDPSDKDGLGVLLGPGVPALLSIVITRWGGTASWVVAILLGIASGAMAAFVLFVGFLVGCSATDCGS